jgi:hypothetical protein
MPSCLSLGCCGRTPGGSGLLLRTLVEQGAFNKTRELFLDTVSLKFLYFSKTFYLQTDGSGVALGVEIYQLPDDGEYGVIGFASRILRGPKLLYTVTEKELFLCPQVPQAVSSSKRSSHSVVVTAEQIRL